VHERHLNTDLLLGLLRELLCKRSDLRLVLMSATINQQLYADYFHRAPVIKVLQLSAQAIQLTFRPCAAVLQPRGPKPRWKLQLSARKSYDPRAARAQFIQSEPRKCLK
jgi:hypothetical protein